VSYLLLGLAVCLAFHVAVALLLSLGVAAAARHLEPRLAALEPARRAPALLLLALLPAGGGLAAGLGLALPAWLVYEPHGRAESPGPVLLWLGVLGALLVFGRLSAALVDHRRTARLVRRWQAAGRELRGLPLPATRVDVDAPVAALAGIRRPRLLLSGALVEALEPGELEAVVAHERAHAAAHENLKRLLLRASPDPLALLPAGERLRAQFEEAAEVAADRSACARVPPLRLARALLKVAALARNGAPLEIAAAALHREGCVAARVRALLHAHDVGGCTGPAAPPRGMAWIVAGFFGLLLAAASACLLPQAYAAAESLVHLLS
jgi:Zn-dependent protease with chaperone function